eukprot:GCRY01002309.1.p1 GENE.GCRY01002309.1~~GCRY01002309.1.p1  ORF type:complete len:215 (+),score=54.12 GCRY01002309.1:153-797(+)
MAGAIHVDIISDITCPWCYVGGTKFKLAMQEFEKTHPDSKISFRWRPFLLDPTREEGVEYHKYMNRKWGNDNWTQHLRAEGKKVGLPFKNWRMMPNTIKSHCLMDLVPEEKEDDVMFGLFRAMYEEGLNLSDDSALVSVGKAAGLEEQQILSHINSPAIQEKIMQEDSDWRRRYRVSGVPFFVIQNATQTQRPIGLSGAQPVDQFVMAFEEVLS